MQYAARILDVNLNRCREGLRVVEEICRFYLNDGLLTAQVKELRHNMTKIAWQIPGLAEKLLVSRNSADDVGADSFSAGERTRSDLFSLFEANFKRTQEGVRVLEEFTKLLDEEAALAFKKLRFDLYTLEKGIYQRLSMATTAMGLGLYLVTGQEFARGRSLAEVVEAALAGGAKVVQLREKKYTTRQLLEAGRTIRRLTRQYNATFLVNDRVDVAVAVEADGAHLGQDDLPVAEARRILGPGKIIGISTHNLEEAIAAEAAGANYIGFGPMYATTTKDGVPDPVGLDALREVRRHLHIPIVAIGGVKVENTADVIRAGADAVAVVTAVVAAPDVEAAARAIAGEITSARHEN